MTNDVQSTVIDPTKPLLVNETEKQANIRANQTSWKPGQSGNPNGRPHKGWAWKELLEEAMDEKDTTGVSNKKIIVKKIVDLAKRGELSAIKEIIDRMDGKAKQSLDMESPGGFNVILNRCNHEHS